PGPADVPGTQAVAVTSTSVTNPFKETCHVRRLRTNPRIPHDRDDRRDDSGGTRRRGRGLSRITDPRGGGAPQPGLPRPGTPHPRAPRGTRPGTHQPGHLGPGAARPETAGGRCAERAPDPGPARTGAGHARRLAHVPAPGPLGRGPVLARLRRPAARLT